MQSTPINDPEVPRYELYAHGADIGIRGFGNSPARALEGAALALTSVICPPREVFPNHCVDIQCQASSLDDLLYAWLNALVYEMATRHMLFSRFRLEIVGTHLAAEAWGEPIDIARHQPAVEVKGATYTDLHVTQSTSGTWTAQCILDV